VLTGLIAEVSLRISALDICTSAATSTAPGSLRPSGSSTPSQSSSGRPFFQADPRVVEAAQGRRAAAPVGARHRQAKFRDQQDSGPQLLEALHHMTTRVALAITLTSNLVTSVQETMSASARQRRPSASPNAASHRSRRSSEAMDQRASALHKSLRSHGENCKAICREARALGACVIHELTATCELFELSAVLGDGDTSIGGISCDTFAREDGAPPCQSASPGTDDGAVPYRSLSPVERRWQPQTAPMLVETLQQCMPPLESPVAMELSPPPLGRLSQMVLKDYFEASVEECCLSTPDRSPTHLEAMVEECRLDALEKSNFEIEVTKSSPTARHVWQVQSV